MRHFTLNVVGLTWLLVACADFEGLPRAEAPLSAPLVTGISTNSASVGDRVTFEGEDFVTPDRGWVDIHFDGTFTPNDGSTPNDVQLTVPLVLSAAGELVWESFGEYRVPFLPGGNKLGVFEGELRATNRFFPQPGQENLGSVLQEEAPIQVVFYVLPSLVVLDNRAFGDSFVADCIEPSTTVLQSLRYALRVKALGFTPASFEFTLGEGLLQLTSDGSELTATDEVTRIRAAGNGDDEHAVVHRWSPNPASSNGYRTQISAKAIGVGMSKSVTFPFIVRPWAYPEFELVGFVAETLEPTPVTACIPGGPNSVLSAYSERTTETQTRQVKTSIDNDFGQRLATSHTESYDFSRTTAFSETRSEEVSTTETLSNNFNINETDLFSSTDRIDRRNGGSWSREVGNRDSTLDQTVGVDERNVSDLTLFEREKVPRIGIDDLLGFDGNAKLSETVGTVYGTVHTTGTRSTRATTQLDSNSAEEFARWFTGNRYETTVGSNRDTGRSWGFSQTYGEQIGFAAERTRARTETYGQSLTTAQQVYEGLGTTQSEVLTQSSSQFISQDWNGFVWAGLQGTWYRQATRILSVGVLVALDFCGNGTPVGTLEFSEWTWAADLAYAEECPPPTNFLPAECRIGPCVGGVTQ